MISSKVIKSKKPSKGLQQLDKMAMSLQKSSVDVGYFDGAMHNGSEMSLASLMTLLEYGSNDGRIPARFPFTQVSATDSPKRDPTVRKIITRELSGAARAGNPNRLLDLLGKHYVNSIGNLFGDTTRLIGNAVVTQRLKGKNSPLIEHGELLRKLKYRKTI